MGGVGVPGEGWRRQGVGVEASVLGMEVGMGVLGVEAGADVGVGVPGVEMGVGVEWVGKSHAWM